MAIKRKTTEDIPIEDKTEIKPFLPKGYIFETEYNNKWLINFNKIPELVKEYYTLYENWFNWKFNNPCICPDIFLRGE